MNKLKQTIIAITLQKFSSNFWSVFSFGLMLTLLFGLFSGFDLLPDNRKNQSKQIQPFNFLPTSTTNQIILHDFYTLSYNEQHEQAEWVAYELKR
jgi:endonuclease G, mitochondrial